jgi:hypothetical protein
MTTFNSCARTTGKYLPATAVSRHALFSLACSLPAAFDHHHGRVNDVLPICVSLILLLAAFLNMLRHVETCWCSIKYIRPYMYDSFFNACKWDAEYGARCQCRFFFLLYFPRTLNTLIYLASRCSLISCNRSIHDATSIKIKCIFKKRGSDVTSRGSHDGCSLRGVLG